MSKCLVGVAEKQGLSQHTQRVVHWNKPGEILIERKSIHENNKDTHSKNTFISKCYIAIKAQKVMKT